MGKGKMPTRRQLDDQRSLLIDVVGVLVTRLPGDDAVRITGADREALRGRHLRMTVDNGDLVLQLAKLEVVQQ